MFKYPPGTRVIFNKLWYYVVSIETATWLNDDTGALEYSSEYKLVDDYGNTKSCVEEEKLLRCQR
jgi:hypothetical protein